MAGFVRGYFSLCVFSGINIKLQAFFVLLGITIKKGMFIADDNILGRLENDEKAFKELVDASEKTRKPYLPLPASS